MQWKTDQKACAEDWSSQCAEILSLSHAIAISIICDRGENYADGNNHTKCLGGSIFLLRMDEHAATKFFNALSGDMAYMGHDDVQVVTKEHG